jgi:hypothetical protein
MLVAAPLPVTSSANTQARLASTVPFFLLLSELVKKIWLPMRAPPSRSSSPLTPSAAPASHSLTAAPPARGYTRSMLDSSSATSM